MKCLFKDHPHQLHIIIIKMNHQEPQRLPFEFQGNTYYRTIIDLKKYKVTTGQVYVVYDSALGGGFIGTIQNTRHEETDELFDVFTITSYAGHTYIYDFNAELLIRFNYAVGMEFSIPTQEEIQKLEDFNQFVIRTNSENNFMGIFHVVDLHELFPQEQVHHILK